MIDLHFDLLTKLYTSYLENDFKYIEQFMNNLNNDNVEGLIANLSFMSKEEMIKEYHRRYYDKYVSVVDMFKISKYLLDKYLPNNILVIMSIEGCDYVDIKDLDVLYNIGLRAVLPIWNEENKYGSGNRTNKVLTDIGKEFILQAIELGIGIDLSHANKETFDDIINVCNYSKSLGLNPIIYASHSNVYKLCDRDRNLSDNQLLKIKELDGIVGLFSHRNFVYKNVFKDNIDNKIIIKQYIEHIRYLENLFGCLDNIAVSTDDMTFCADKHPDYHNCPIFNYESIKNDLTFELSKYYNKDDINKILKGNSKTLFKKFKRSR